MNRVSEAREKYRPEYIKTIFIAEAPPCTDDRFFYFENITKGDSLFLHIIRAVFPELEHRETKAIRAKKEELLLQFRDQGYFLEDSVAEAIPKGTKPKDKERIIVENQNDLIRRILPYKTQSKLVVLSATVFKANYELLKENGFNILNDSMIPFPGSGQQSKFKAGIALLDL